MTRHAARMQRIVMSAVLLGTLAPAARQQELRAQSTRSATLTGRVTDATTKRVVANAEIRAIGPDTVVQRSNAVGQFRTAPLVAGTYRVTVRAIGYRVEARIVEVRPNVSNVSNASNVLEFSLDRLPVALDQVVVTSARRSQTRGDAVQAVDVVSRADIEQTGATDLASVLVEQLGITLQQGHPAGAGVMLQGIGSERVLVLLDGQPISGRLSGVFDISRIPVSVVERVEVVKGAQSALYGTDAMGGVVNVITRRPSESFHADISTTAGTQERRDGSATASLTRNAFAASLSGGHRHVRTAPGVASANGALAARTDVAMRIGAGNDSTRWIESSVLALDERQRWRTSTFYNFGDNRQWSARLSGGVQRSQHRFSSTVSSSNYEHVSRASIGDRPLEGDAGQRQLQQVDQAELLYNGRFGARQLALDLGTQVRRDRIETARVPGGRRSLTVLEPFVQAEFAIGPSLTLSPGTRVSNSTLWGTNTTSRVAARWRATNALTVRASLGEGFRVPDFKELFMFFQNTGAGYAVYGNPDLQPESSTNMTLSSEWTGRRAFARGQLFETQFSDFIETQPITLPDEPQVYRYANIDNGSTRGIEIESGVTIARVRAEAGYAGLWTRDDRTSQPLLGRPQHSARATVNSTLPFAIRANVSVIFTGETPMQRDAATGSITAMRDAFTRMDARIVRSIVSSTGRLFDVSVGVDNVFDRRPANWAGFAARHIYTSLTWTWDKAPQP